MGLVCLLRISFFPPHLLTIVNYLREDVDSFLMRQTPCEQMLWDRLPAIRRELALALINEHGLSQREAADLLGVTPAAVCQYLAKKRGHATVITEALRDEILLSADRIKNNGSPAAETCRLCKLISQMTKATPSTEPAP